jgi:hypothetical protein
MKFPILNPNHPDHDLCDLAQALADFHAEFHEHAPTLTPGEFQEMQAAYQDIIGKVHLSRKQWICLLGMHFLTNNDAIEHDNRPRW